MTTRGDVEADAGRVGQHPVDGWNATAHRSRGRGRRCKRIRRSRGALPTRGSQDPARRRGAELQTGALALRRGTRTGVGRSDGIGYHTGLRTVRSLWEDPGRSRAAAGACRTPPPVPGAARAGTALPNAVVRMSRGRIPRRIGNNETICSLHFPSSKAR